MHEIPAWQPDAAPRTFAASAFSFTYLPGMLCVRLAAAGDAQWLIGIARGRQTSRRACRAHSGARSSRQANCGGARPAPRAGPGRAGSCRAAAAGRAAMPDLVGRGTLSLRRPTTPCHSHPPPRPDRPAPSALVQPWRPPWSA
jgi:hypothetical protein